MGSYHPEGILMDSMENRLWIGSVEKLREAKLTGKILEGRVSVCDIQHNLVVELGNGLQGVIPRCSGAMGIDTGATRDIALITRVNKPVCFTVEEVTDSPSGTPQILLSRVQAQKLCLHNYIRHLEAGQVIAGRITHLDRFGAFVDVGCGLPALLPIDAISISRISHPKDRFTSGQLISAVVRSVTPAGRVTLSYKELLGTWEENAAKFTPGETVCGIVRSIEAYGIFVELTPNLAGLAELRPDVKVGQSACVFIKSIFPSRMKIKLIIVDAFDSDQPPAPMQCYLDTDRIHTWRYSPADCPKIIESVF